MYRFNIDDPQCFAFLVENGFVVVANVLTQEETTQYLSDSWDIIEELSAVRKNDPSTRKPANYPYMMHGGMIQYLGHSKMQWEIREKVAHIFARLYNKQVNELSTSFDGLCFMDGMRKFRKTSPISYIHVDQTPNNREFGSYQGVVCLTTNGITDGGFVCVPGTHTYFEFWDDLIEEGKTFSNENWYLFSDNEKQHPMFSQWQKICNEAGDLILFDSRLWHCNTTPTSDALRVATYVCMLPKPASPQLRQKRANAASTGRVSSHHPWNVKLFPKKPRWCGDLTYEKATQIQSRVVLTDMQKILADIA